jgi:hypothetical protein
MTCVSLLSALPLAHTSSTGSAFASASFSLPSAHSANSHYDTYLPVLNINAKVMCGMQICQCGHNKDITGNVKIYTKPQYAITSLINTNFNIFQTLYYAYCCDTGSLFNISSTVITAVKMFIIKLGGLVKIDVSITD